MQQTQNEILNSYIDKLGYLVFDMQNAGIVKIPAKVAESKCTFGKLSILVKPLVGEGQIWLRVLQFSKLTKEWTPINGNRGKPQFELDNNADIRLRNYVNVHLINTL